MDTKGYAVGEVIFDGENHKVVWLGWDTDDSGGAVQTNQYLIIHGSDGFLLDPGGVHLFSRVVSVISRYIDLDRIREILFSHQDPDVSSGIALWLGITEATIRLSSLWLRFVPHFGLVQLSRITEVPDRGEALSLGGEGEIRMIPAHFLHSPGNFSYYDTISGILFSGDIGAAVFPTGSEYLYVEDFDKHLGYMEGFHRRYMASNKVCANWVKRVRAERINMIAPQHGAIFPENQVNRFLDWFSDLQCGSDIIETINES